MKLQKLIIKNIASITDATIDFDSEPLSSCDLFLISGPTGAGKTTILDSICLALYGKTPRLNGKDPNVKQNEATIQDLRDIKPHAATNIMTRGKGFCSVELTYTGNDGRHYKAVWSVQRAYRKPDGRMQAVEWSVTDVDADVVYNKVAEVTEVVKASVGLEFEQFCRTVMLAQGDFTRFLKSDTKEKSDILEKITGLDVYSTIGRKIYNMFSVRDAEVKAFAKKIADADIKTDEEIAELKASKDAKTQQSEDLKKEHDIAGDKIQWLKKRNDLEKEKSSLSAKLAKAEEAEKDPELETKRQTLEEWDKSREVRGKLKDLDKAQKDLEETKVELEKSRDEYPELKHGVVWLEGEVERLGKQLDDLDAKINSESNRASVYENVKAVVNKINDYHDVLSKISAKSQSLAEKQSKYDNEISPNSEKLTEETKSRKHALDNLQKEVEDLADKLKELGEDNLIDQKQKLERQSNELDNLLKLRRDCYDALTRRDNSEKDLSKRLADIQSQTDEANKLKKDVENAAEISKRDKELYERQLLFGSEATKNLRAHLVIGEPCPVCSRVVDHIEEHVSSISELIEMARKQAKESEEKHNDLKDKYSRADGAIRAARRQYDIDRKKLDEDKEYDNKHNEYVKALEKLGISADSDVPAVVNERKASIAKSGEEIAAAMTVVKDVKTKREEKEAERKKAQAEYESSLKKSNAADTEKAKAEQEIKALKDSIKELGENRNNLAEEITDELTPGFESAKALTEKDETIQLLNSGAESYRKLCKDRDDARNVLKDMKSELGNVGGDIENLCKELPGAQEPMMLEVHKVDNLREKINDLLNKIASRKATIEALQRNVTECNEEIDKYIEENAVDVNRLLDLNKLSDRRVKEYSDAVNKATKEITEIRANLAKNEADIAQQMDEAPEFAEGEDEKTLASRQKELDKQRTELAKQIGSIEGDLDTDNKNRAKHEAELAEYDRLREVFADWKRLNDYLGDSQGVKLKKIAQSYVLKNLIASANAYLEKLSRRYKLVVTPGSFDIDVEDSWSGYERRGTTTLSGGEGFLVSLALALGLGDLAGRAWVDTLFVDEGFGSLSGEPLLAAIDTLRSLKGSYGRRVGVISHVELMKERIGVQLRVGNSQVTLTDDAVGA